MKEFLEFVAKHLVDNPGAVQVMEETRGDRLVFRLRVDPGEVGKVIGKEGRTAHAMRILLAAVAAKEGRRALLEIED